MTEKKPALLIGDEAVELKIKPKACVLCGKPYIPTGPGAKFCPACRKMPRGKRNASLFAKHAELAFGPGPWATYKPEPVKIPDAFQMAIDTARMIAHEVKTDSLNICSVSWTFKSGCDFLGQVLVVPETFYKIFDELPFEYEHDEEGRIKAHGRIDGVEVISWLQ